MVDIVLPQCCSQWMKNEWKPIELATVLMLWIILFIYHSAYQLFLQVGWQIGSIRCSWHWSCVQADVIQRSLQSTERRLLPSSSKLDNIWSYIWCLVMHYCFVIIHQACRPFFKIWSEVGKFDVLQTLWLVLICAVSEPCFDFHCFDLALFFLRITGWVCCIKSLWEGKC